MRRPTLVLGLFLLFAPVFHSISGEDCCLTKTVIDEKESGLNGVYTLKTKEDSKRDPKCIDGCVYMRDNEEYCFIEKLGATVVCEV